MIILLILLTPIIYIFIKLILSLIVFKFGKISYKDFSAVGFAYNSKDDLFYSTKNAWQKNFGYCHLYDVSAPIFRMIIDTQPVKFYYNNKNWLMTFWKGQYGITTGAEIGIYCTNEKKVNKKTVYFPASNDEMLIMSFTLYKKDEEIIKVSAKHWWLAAFKLGMFSKPKDLSMKVSVTFPNYEMLEAFLNSFKKLKYKDDDYKIIHKTFIFTFKKPHTHKVWTRTWLSDMITQHLNHKNVKLYNKYFSDIVDNQNQNKVIKVDDMIPNILKNNNMIIEKSDKYE